MAPAVLLPYQVTRRILHAWPDTVHQLEKETGLCFDLPYFSALLTATNYSTASDYLVSFWTHSFYRTILSRTDHCRVRQQLVSIMDLKLTLLSMTTDRLALEFFIEKEFKPKLLSLSLNLVDVEDLIRKAYCSIRARFAVPVQALRHTVWFELTRGGEGQLRSSEQVLITQFVGDPMIVNAHKRLAQEIRALPFHFATTDVPRAAGAEAASRQQMQEQRQPARSGEEEKTDVRREEVREAKEEKEAKDENVSTPPSDTVTLTPPVLPPIDYRRHERHRKRHHREKRKERDGTRERRHKRRHTTDATREVIEVDSDSDRTASDNDEKADRDERTSSISRTDRTLLTTPPSDSSPSPRASSSSGYAESVYSQSPPDLSTSSSPSAADLEPLSALINRHRMHLSASQLGEDYTIADSTQMAVDESEQKAVQRYDRPSTPPPSNPAGYVDMQESAESEPIVEEAKDREQAGEERAADGEMSVNTGVQADSPSRVEERIERKEDIDPMAIAISSLPELPGSLPSSVQHPSIARLSHSGRCVDSRLSSDAAAFDDYSSDDAPLVIKKGKGTRLSDIENIEYRILLTRSISPSLVMLHRVLFPLYNGVPNNNHIKSHIRKFSGWSSSEEGIAARQRLEELDVKELKVLADLLHATKGNNKEQLINRIVEFCHKPGDAGMRPAGGDLLLVTNGANKSKSRVEESIERKEESAPRSVSPAPSAAAAATSTSSSTDNLWECALCTFRNIRARSVCEVCNSPHKDSTSCSSATVSQPSSKFTSSPASSSSGPTSSARVMPSQPPPVPPAQMGRPLPPRNVPRTKQTARKSTAGGQSVVLV